MEKLQLQTTNMVDENIKRIGELFPNCLTERMNEKGQPEMAIDFDQDKQEYVHNSGQYDEEGNQLVTNTESNQQGHHQADIVKC